MGRPRSFAFIVASAVLVMGLPSSVHAQGNGKGKGHQSSPPSSSLLPGPTAGGSTTSGASPLGWVDDASVLTPGTIALTFSAMRWSGADLSEVDFPIVDVSVGLTPRVQLGVSIPRIVGSADGTGPVGGFGTSYISGKYVVLTGMSSGVKLAVAPMIQILGAGAAQALPAGEGRMQFGLPVSAEITRGPARIFGSTGFFSRGAWYAGGGTAAQLSPRLAISLSFSRAWANDALTGLLRDRRDLSGGASYFVKPRVALFGSLGRTMSTADADGAGTTLGAGITFFVTPVRAQVTR